MSQLTEHFNEQLKAIKQYNERRFVMMILDKTQDSIDKATLASEKEKREKTECLSGSGIKVNERPKYFNLLDALVHLSGAVFIVQKLCDDIVGVKQFEVPTPDEEPVKEPCLLEVLERTPGNIHAGCNMIEETVKEIRAQIL